MGMEGTHKRKVVGIFGIFFDRIGQHNCKVVVVQDAFDDIAKHRTLEEVLI